MENTGNPILGTYIYLTFKAQIQQNIFLNFTDSFILIQEWATPLYIWTIGTQ